MAHSLLIPSSDGVNNLSSYHTQLTCPELEPLCHIITPVGMLGYGFDENLTRQALESLKANDVPTALILDSGSTDSGPAKLALGGMTAPRSSYERDLSKLLSLINEYQTAPAGGDGTDAHVDVFLDIIREICDEEDNSHYKFKAISIYSNVSKTHVLGALRAGRVQGCGPTVKPLTESDVERAVTIVAQIGPEPFVTAMEAEPDFNIIISGRAYDPSPYSAFCTFQAKQYSPKAPSHQQLGGFTHMGKVMECGGLCATPKSASAMATVYLDGTFDVEPLNDDARCTPFSVASHTLYEKTRPDILLGPGGELDLTGTSYIQLPDQRTTRVYGAAFEFSRDIGLPYTVKLEAAKIVGYRSIYMGGIRDPILISQISNFQSQIREFVASQVKPSDGEVWKLGFHVYGVNGIMGSLEPGAADHQPREIFLIGEVLASSQKLAHYVAHTARIATIHGSYPGQRGTGINFAMGVGGKTEVDMGPCGKFCIYHLIPLVSGEENARRIGDKVNVEADERLNSPLFSWKLSVIGKGEKSTGFSPSTPIFPTLKGNLINPDQQSVHSIVSTLNLINPTTLADIAPVIRSKNAGPYEITLDVVFSSPSVFYIIKSTSLLSPSLISRLYDIQEEKIIWCGYYDQALAWKCTIPRMGVDIGDGIKGNIEGQRGVVPNGSFMESDVHASQQYVGLLGLKLDAEVKEKLRKLALGENAH